MDMNFSMASYVGVTILAFVAVGIPIYNFINNRYKDKLYNEQRRLLDIETKSKIDQEQEIKIERFKGELSALKGRVSNLESQHLMFDSKLAKELEKIDNKIDILIEKIINISLK